MPLFVPGFDPTANYTLSGAWIFGAGTAANPKFNIGTSGYGIFQATNQLGFSVAGSMILDWGITQGSMFSSAGGFRALGGAIRTANYFEITGKSTLSSNADGSFTFNNQAATTGATLTFPSGLATLQLGAANAASPVAQTLQAQGSRAGTDANIGGANFVAQPGQGTGTGTPSSFTLNTPLGTTSSTTAAQPMTQTLQGIRSSVVIGPSTQISTSATDGFLYLPQCAGTVTGTPTTLGTTAPIIYDATNNKLWAYNGAWRSVTLT